MGADQFTRCRCAECQKLDALPVRRHGIPHAWQPNMLSGCGGHAIAPAAPEEFAEIANCPSSDDLPLFGGGLDPVLL